MKCLRPLLFCAVFMLAAAGLSGCLPQGDTRQDEEHDPHFQRGRDLINSQEFKAAVEEFEKALDTNPRSAAAHYELGWLYDTKANDYAAAIYHYERHLELLTNSPHSQLVRERIRGCKLELASTEFPLPNSQALQQQVFALIEENRLLKEQLQEARSRGVVAPAVPSQPNPPPAPNSITIASPPAVTAIPPAGTSSPNPVSPAKFTVPATGTANAPHSRTYIIQAGDNIYGIARRYGLKANAVLAVNANVNPARLHPGQSLNLP